MILVKGHSKEKWNAALYSIKRELHNIIGGLDVSALNTVYSLYVNAYNRCIRLLKELDEKYGSFIPPTPDYYDELPNDRFVDVDSFTVELKLVLTKFDSLPKLNTPIISLNDALISVNSSWRDFTYSYATRANGSVAKVNVSNKDRGEHIGAYQSYINKLVAYTTPEQIEKALEDQKNVVNEVIVTITTENAQSLGAVTESMESSKDAILDADTTGSSGLDAWGDPGDTSALTEKQIDDNIQSYKDAQKKAEEAAKASEAERERLAKELQDAQNALAEAQSREEKAKKDQTDAMMELSDDGWTITGSNTFHDDVLDIGASYDGNGKVTVTNSDGTSTQYTKGADGTWADENGNPASSYMNDHLDTVNDYGTAADETSQSIRDRVNAESNVEKAESNISASDTSGDDGTMTVADDGSSNWHSNDYDPGEWDF